MAQLYIDEGITQSRAAVFENNNITGLYVENHLDFNICGNIYKGRIENIVEGLDACFINIGESKNGIYHFTSVQEKNSLKRGQEILVQVIRESSKDKGPKLTRNISIPGKFIVLLPGDSSINVSRKIDNIELQYNLRKIAREIMDESGIILRTEAQYENEETLKNEYKYLNHIWEGIDSKFKYIKAPCVLYNSRRFYEFVLREYFKNDVDDLILNKKEDISKIEAIIDIQQDISKKVHFQDNSFKMTDLLEHLIQSSLEKAVGLPSGGFLYIEKTEALNVIDVNTGSFTGDEDKEKTVFRTNLEACDVIFNQIQIRNLSGIIIIDFIDMEKGKNKKAILDYLKELFKKDVMSTNLYGFTKLGLLEMSRAKKGKDIYSLTGSTNLLSDDSICYNLKKVENKCVKEKNRFNANNFNVFLQDETYKIVNEKFSFFVIKMKEVHNIHISLLRDDKVANYLIKRE